MSEEYLFLKEMSSIFFTFPNKIFRPPSVGQERGREGLSPLGQGTAELWNAYLFLKEMSRKAH